MDRPIHKLHDHCTELKKTSVLQVAVHVDIFRFQNMDACLYDHLSLNNLGSEQTKVNPFRQSKNTR